MSMRSVDYGPQTHSEGDHVRDWATRVGRPTQVDLRRDLTERGLLVGSVMPEGAASDSGTVLDGITGMLAPQHYLDRRVMWINHRGSLGRTILEDILPRAGTQFVWSSSCDLALTRRFMRADLADRSVVVPSPIRTDIFHPDAGDARIEDEFGGRQVVLYMGRLDTEKRIDHLIWFTKLLVERAPDALVVVTGYFPATEAGMAEGAYLRQLARALGLSDSVRFVGRIDGPEAVAALFRRASVSVNFTVNHDEAYGYAQVESASCGTPVVGAGWGGLLDTIHQASGHRVTTMVTGHGTFIDLHDAAQQVAHLLTSPAELEERSRLAAAWGAEHRWDRYVDALTSLAADSAAPAGGETSRVPGTMSELLVDVMSPELAERWRPVRNLQLDDLSPEQYCALRNQRHISATDEASLELFADLAAFRRDNYQFVQRDYAMTSAEEVVAGLDPTSLLRPVAFDVDVHDDRLVGHDLVFGERTIATEPQTTSVWQSIVATPNQTAADIAARLRSSETEVVAELRTLIRGGFVYATSADPVN